ncbi:MAG: hypothetical protein PVF50_06970 [Gammaproteobacteria bacterium]|jgi:hypothetical protein
MSKSLTGLTALTLAGLAGCAGIVTADGTAMRPGSAAFTAYAERVFRLQNQVLDALAFALEAQPDEMTLIAAEDSVLRACAGLNEIAVRRQRGAAARVLRDARTARRIPECEAAAIAAADRLAPSDP